MSEKKNQVQNPNKNVGQTIKDSIEGAYFGFFIPEFSALQMLFHVIASSKFKVHVKRLVLQVKDNSVRIRHARFCEFR